MFKVMAKRLGSTFQQSFNSWNEANAKSKYLATQGFVVEIIKVD